MLFSFQGTHLCDSYDCVTSFSQHPYPPPLPLTFLVLVPPAALWSWEVKESQYLSMEQCISSTHHYFHQDEKIHVETKGFKRYVLVKQLQVLYGNCLFKYPKEKALLVKLCINQQMTTTESTKSKQGDREEIC